MISKSIIGKCVVRLTLLTYLIFTVVSLLDFDPSVSDQKLTLFSKSAVKGFSLVVNEEKEKEGDESQFSLQTQTTASSFLTVDTRTRLRSATGFVDGSRPAKVFLLHRSLLI